MKVAFDTNVLLDTILNRPGRENALRLMLAVSEEKIAGVVSANSITDLYYLARKGIGDQAAREAIFDVLSIFDVAPVDGDACSMALNTPMSDCRACRMRGEGRGGLHRHRRPRTSEIRRLPRASQNAGAAPAFDRQHRVRVREYRRGGLDYYAILL